MKKKVLVIALSLSMILAFTACGGGSGGGEASAEKEVWKVSAMGSETNPVTLGWYEFERLIEEKLPNVDVQVFENGQLGTSTDDCIGGLQNGSIHFSDLSTGNVTEFSNAYTVLDQPFLFNNKEEARAAITSEAGDLMNEKFLADANVVNLGYWDFGFRNLTNSKKEIASKADLDGLKIRTLTSDVYVKMIAAMGASPTAMAYSEVFTGLQQGTIDGEENPLATIVDAGFYEVNPYITLDGHIYAWLGFFCSADWFNSLDADTQQILKECAAQACQAEIGYNDDAEAAAMTTLQEAGCTITEVSDEAKAEWREACQSLYDDCKNSVGEEYYNSVMAALGK